MKSMRENVVPLQPDSSLWEVSVNKIKVNNHYDNVQSTYCNDDRLMRTFKSIINLKDLLILCLHCIMRTSAISCNWIQGCCGIAVKSITPTPPPPPGGGGALSYIYNAYWLCTARDTTIFSHKFPLRSIFHKWHIFRSGASPFYIFAGPETIIFEIPFKPPTTAYCSQPERKVFGQRSGVRVPSRVYRPEYLPDASYNYTVSSGDST